MATMSAEDKLRWYTQSIRLGGSVMHEGRLITRIEDLPSLGALAATEEEKATALSDIEAQRRKLDEEEARLRAGATQRAASAGSAARNAPGGRSGDGLTSADNHPGGDGASGGTNDPGVADDDLPEDFHARETLVKAGFTKRSQVKALTEEELVGLKIAPATARKIVEALR